MGGRKCKSGSGSDKCDWGEEVSHRVLKGKKIWGVMVKLWNENIPREVKQKLYERVMIPTVETWSLRAQKSRKIKVFVMMCLRNICSIMRVDRVRNAIIREKCGYELSALERIERNVLKWIGQVERIGEGRLVKCTGKCGG